MCVCVCVCVHNLFSSQDQVYCSFQRNLQVTPALIKRLGLETELEGHTGCVNCLEWNETGRCVLVYMTVRICVCAHVRVRVNERESVWVWMYAHDSDKCEITSTPVFCKYLRLRWQFKTSGKYSNPLSEGEKKIKLVLEVKQ